MLIGKHGAAKSRETSLDKQVGKIGAELVGVLDRIGPLKYEDGVRLMVDVEGALVDGMSAVSRASDALKAELGSMDAVTKAALDAIRSRRMAVISETSTLISTMRELRQFFVGADYERERQRLADFVDLCERLQKLKESGFLDTVADTMLRLALQQPGK